MVIAVNTRFLLVDYLEGYGNFIYETFRRITEQHPEHEFIFIFDRPYDKRFLFSNNIKTVVTGPAARHPLLWKLWYDIKVPVILKRYKVDVFVSCDGFCSLGTKVPQCLVVHDLAFLHYPSTIKKSHLLFYKRYTPKFLGKAISIATVSEFSKKDIIAQYGTDAKKINVVCNGVKEIFNPINNDAKATIKNKYTDGKEYFIYAGSIHPRKNLITLLKAFSVFKIIGAAYGLVYPSFFEGFGVPVLEAMRCDVPVITSADSAMQEIAKDAALYADANSHTDIANKMMLLYKDENLRKELILKGRQIVKQYSWDKTATLLWQSIVKVMP